MMRRRRDQRSSRRDLTCETVLRGMDSATARHTHSEADLNDAARAALEHIVATPPDQGATTTPPPRAQGAPGGGARRPLRGRRALLLASATALVVAGGVGVPLATSSAYAGWRQSPQPVDAEGTAAAGDACREYWSRVGSMDDMRDYGYASAKDFHAVLSERRGPFTFTVMRGPQGQFADCLLQTRWWGGLESGGGTMTGTPTTGPVAADRIDTAISGAVGPSTRSIFGIDLPGDGQIRNYTYGRAGSDVTGVVVHTTTRGDIAASVQNGVWVAWWPSPGERPDIEALTATTTLRDGRTEQLPLDELRIPWSDAGWPETPGEGPTSPAS